MEDCLIWPGALNSGGYPVTWENGKAVYAHRVIIEAKPGEVVMHTCDNPSCVNPRHLKLGFPKDNSKDMTNKNRQAKGESCGNSKLTELEVFGIRSMQDVAPEQARMVLPQNTMTEWIWTGSLMFFARVCKLRLDSHAQQETQEIAKMINDLIPDNFKHSWNALMSN